MTTEEINARIAKIEQMIASRKGQTGYAANVAACEAELVTLRAMLAE